MVLVIPPQVFTTFVPVRVTRNVVERARREAKRVRRTEGITQAQALDRQAVDMGFGSWAGLMLALNCTRHGEQV